MIAPTSQIDMMNIDAQESTQPVQTDLLNLASNACAATYRTSSPRASLPMYRLDARRTERPSSSATIVGAAFTAMIGVALAAVCGLRIGEGHERAAARQPADLRDLRALPAPGPGALESEHVLLATARPGGSSRSRRPTRRRSWT